MERGEVLLLEKGQPNLRAAVPKTPYALRLLFLDPAAVFSALSDLIMMRKEFIPQQMFFSYISSQVFKGMTEEKFTSAIPAAELFKGTIGQIKKENPNIENLKVEDIGGITKFIVFLKEPDWDLEQLIYNKFAEIEDLYKDKEFDIEIEELFI